VTVSLRLFLMSRPEVVKGVWGHDERCEMIGLAWVSAPRTDRSRRGICISIVVVQY
jgi:hypothetical protein